MICKTCGTEIANKALICYRCGIETSGPRHQRLSSDLSEHRAWPPIFLGGVFLLAVSFFLVLSVDGESVPAAVWLMLGAAGILLVWRLRR